MSESFVNPLFGRTVHAVNDDEVPAEGTGNQQVDAVVASLEGLDELDVSEHVAVFEQAHESLRRTLAGAGPSQVAAARG